MPTDRWLKTRRDRNGRSCGLARTRCAGGVARCHRRVWAAGWGRPRRGRADSLLNRLRLAFNRKAALSPRELTRLRAVAELACEVARDEGGAEGARRFWDAPMPWLGGSSPADTLARGDIGVIEDLRVRINYGIPP